MYLNYDGRNGAFGDTSVAAESSDIGRASVYASVDRGRQDGVVLVAVNRSEAPLTAEVALTHPQGLARAEVYRLTAAAPGPKRDGELPVSRNRFRCPLPAMSVATIVLRP